MEDYIVIMVWSVFMDFYSLDDHSKRFTVHIQPVTHTFIQCIYCSLSFCHIHNSYSISLLHCTDFYLSVDIALMSLLFSFLVLLTASYCVNIQLKMKDLVST